MWGALPVSLPYSHTGETVDNLGIGDALPVDHATCYHWLRIVLLAENGRIFVISHHPFCIRHTPRHRPSRRRRVWIGEASLGLFSAEAQGGRPETEVGGFLVSWRNGVSLRFNKLSEWAPKPGKAIHFSLPIASTSGIDLHPSSSIGRAIRDPALRQSSMEFKNCSK